MTDTRNDDWLDRQLRADARVALPDQGFTQRTLAALPGAFDAAPSPWLKPALVIGSTALGGILATVLAPVGPMVLEGAAELARMRGFTPAVAVLLAMTSILAVAGYILATDE